MIEDVMVESITKIANHKMVIQETEAHIAFPLQVEPWMTKRVLTALILFMEEYERLSQNP